MNRTRSTCTLLCVDDYFYFCKTCIFIYWPWRTSFQGLPGTEIEPSYCHMFICLFSLFVFFICWCGWLVGWLVGWSVGRLVGWLVGWLVVYLWLLCFDFCFCCCWPVWKQVILQHAVRTEATLNPGIGPGWRKKAHSFNQMKMCRWRRWVLWRV